jgi:hypothetical protein
MSLQARGAFAPMVVEAETMRIPAVAVVAGYLYNGPVEIAPLVA